MWHKERASQLHDPNCRVCSVCGGGGGGGRCHLNEGQAAAKEDDLKQEGPESCETLERVVPVARNDIDGALTCT